MLQLTPSQCREYIRHQEHIGPTSGLAPGYLQANLVILPQAIASDFAIFAERNAKPCPILEVLSPGDRKIKKVADASVVSDFPAYRIFNYDVITEDVLDIQSYWREDLVSFFIGCSFTVDHLLQQRGVRLKYIEHGATIPIYVTNRQTQSSEFFSGPLVVSMRYIKRDRLDEVVSLTADYPLAHGAPVFWGDPEELGILDIRKPDYGQYFEPDEDEIPVFWACGITPQLCAKKEKIDLMITHKPGHMLICDIKNTQLYQMATPFI